MRARVNQPFAGSEGVYKGQVPASLKSTGDFVLRLAFFATAPLLIVAVAAVFPVTGALVMVGLALGAFIFGEAVRSLAARHRLLARLLKNQLAFEAYYRAHPPKPFLYYVFYPLLFPYWLSVKEARVEFWLYKGYTVFSIAVLVGGSVWQFFEMWRPELGLSAFLGVFLAQLLAETLLVLMLVMPIVTTVVRFHALGARWRLAVLLCVGMVSSAVAVVALERRRDPIVSFATRERVGMRTAAKPKRAHDVQLAALREAWKVLPKEKEDIDSDGKVEGDALEKAHEKLADFYKTDEAFSFDMWLSRTKKQQILVVYFEARRGRPPIFLALDRAGHEIHDPKALPKGALVAMKQAADGVIE